MTESNDNNTGTATDPNPRLKIEDLRYMVMEGGGARGTVYLGAIQAIESQLNDLVARSAAPNGDGRFTLREIKANRKPGILDYLKNEPSADGVEHITPMLDGVIGASSGAVTAIALLLGLNSEEITEVLSFDFTNFISEDHTGKYRMIDENSQLKIGEDKSVYANDEEKVFGTKKDAQMGGDADEFKYTLKANKTEVKGNRVKWWKRELAISMLVKVIFDGVGSNILQLARIFRVKNEESWYNRLLNGFFGIFNKANGTSSAAKVALARTIQTDALNLILFGWIKNKLPIKVTPNVIVAVFKERGMFSAFQVREFFYDMMLFALTKDTYFQQQVIAYYNKGKKSETIEEKKDLLSADTFRDQKIANAEFKLGKRSEYNFSDKALEICVKLQDLTFTEFHAIMKVELAAAVSNFTTNSPIFFSENYTPDFRVLEAVASSMSLPPAMRAVFNESDVVFNLPDGSKEPRINHLTEKTFRDKTLSVKIDGKNTPFVTADGPGKTTFSRSDYELYDYVVKKGLQQYLLKPENGSVYIDLNNVIEINTLMPLLRKLLIGERKIKVLAGGVLQKEDLTFSVWKDEDVLVNKKTYTVTLELLLFYYNAQFKGMLIDGGYFNNIPFSYARDKFEDRVLRNTIVIKLDGSYPPYFMAEINELFKQANLNEKDIRDLFELELLADSIEILKLVNKQQLEGKMLDPQKLKYEDLIKKIQAKFDAYSNTWLTEGNVKKEDKVLSIDEKLKINRKHIIKVIEHWYEVYGKRNQIKPWATPRSIVEIAFTGYAYGAKRGQIRNPSDHNFIVPLYDFGVDTYDFDLTKVTYLERAAHVTARKDINDYFKR